MRVSLSSLTVLGLAAIQGIVATQCPVADISIVANTGKSVGTVENHNDSMFAYKPVLIYFIY